MKKTSYFILAFLISGLTAQGTAGVDFEPVYALVGCRVVTVAGSVLEKGTIVIRDGLIADLGPSDAVPVPEDADIIDGRGLTAYPGFIDLHSRVFLEPPREETPSGLRGSTPTPAAPAGLNPDLHALKLIKPKASERDEMHRLGFTTVLVPPQRGIFAGQSVLLNLNGEEVERMVVLDRAALHVNFVTERGVYPSSLMGTMAALRQSFSDADHYLRSMSAWKSSPRGTRRPKHDAFLEALAPFTAEKKPVIFTCENQEDIKRAVRLSGEFGLRAMISGANEAWRVAETLRRARLPLFISLSFKPPATSFYALQGDDVKKKAEGEVYPANAAALQKAGIPFALTTQGLARPADFLKNLRTAIAAGLPREEALRALTIHPARFLGLDAFLGSLEKGKSANIVLVSGEIFEEKTTVDRVFVDGRMFRVEKSPPPGSGPPPASPSLAGTWTGTLSAPMGDLDITLVIVQEGESISGAVRSDMGSWDVVGGALRGDVLTFTLKAVMMGQPMELPFEGRLDKDVIEGALSSPRVRMDVRLKRSPGS